MTEESAPSAISPQRRVRSGVPRVFLLLIWYECIRLGLSLYPDALGRVLSETWWRMLAGPSLLVLGMALLIPGYLRRDGLSVQDLGFSSRISLAELRWGVLAGAIIGLLNWQALDVAHRAVGTGAANSGGAFVLKPFLARRGPLDLLGVMFGVAVQMPILEEALFRGCLIRSLEARWGKTSAATAASLATSAFLFAVVHELGHPLYMLIYFATGLAFAGIYQRTRSLNAVIIAHGAINAGSLWMLLRPR